MNGRQHDSGTDRHRADPDGHHRRAVVPAETAHGRIDAQQTFRSALNRSVQYVADNPVCLFVDSGQLVATSAASLSWEYRYTLNVVITDFTGDQNLLMAPGLL